MIPATLSPPIRVLLGVICLAACSSNEAGPPSTAADDAGNATPPEGAGPVAAGCEVTEAPVAVSLSTEDGLTLEADFYPSGVAKGPAAVLLHMIPPSNDKSNFPAVFIQALRDRGLSVLNVNRRGAGASDGEPRDAYEGPSGRLDAVAAHRFVTESGCLAPVGSVVFVAASNGTTTALDFSVEAAPDARPSALVFLSPGGYTENQHTVADNAEVLATIPVMLGYPDSERAWPNAVGEYKGQAWELHEYDDGRHGAGLFESNPDVIDDIVGFLDRTLSP